MLAEKPKSTSFLISTNSENGKENIKKKCLKDKKETQIFRHLVKQQQPKNSSLHPSSKNINAPIFVENLVENESQSPATLKSNESNLDKNVIAATNESLLIKSNKFLKFLENPEFFPGISQAEDDPKNNSWNNFHWNGQDNPSMIDINADGPRTYWCSDQWNHNKFNSGTPWRGLGCQFEFCGALGPTNLESILPNDWNDKLWNEPNAGMLGIGLGEIIDNLDIFDNEKNSDEKKGFDIEIDGGGWW